MKGLVGAEEGVGVVASVGDRPAAADDLPIKRVGPDTWRNYGAKRDRFRRWTTERGVSPEEVTRRDMLAYVGSMADLESENTGFTACLG